MIRRIVRTTLAAALSLTPAMPVGAQPAVIGSVAAANEEILGTPPAAQPRPLRLGAEIVSDERVETGPLGAGQFLFLDRTTLTVWPDSDVVLDRFVYDPSAGAGEMALGMTRGLMRFIGGAVSKSNDVIVRTPHAVVAVRGGIANIEVGSDFTRVVHIAGAYTEINGLRLARSNAAGEAREDAPGEATYLGLISGDALRSAFTQPIGRGTGGLPMPPQPQRVETLIETTGVAAAGASRPGAATAPRLSTYGEQEQAPAAIAEQAPTATVTVSQQAVVRTEVAEGGLVTPVTPPQPSRRPAGGVPILGVSGAQFTATGSLAAQNIAVRPDNLGRFVVFLRAPDPAGGFRVYAEGPDEEERPTDFWFRMRELNDLSIIENSAFNGQRARQVTFDDPGIFYISTFRSLEGAEIRSLNFFGTPTPVSLWQIPYGPDITVRQYDISDEVFTGRNHPFSENVPNLPGFESEGLFFIPQPESPGLSAAFLESTAKWLIAGFHLTGEGTEQSSSLAAFTTRATTNDIGSPIAPSGTQMRLSLRFDAFDRGATGTANLGVLDDGVGNTVFGPNGEYLLLGQGGRTVATGPDAQPQRDLRNRLSGEIGGGPVDIVYGDTRLASLEAIFPLAMDERTPLGAPLLTGGFAVTHAASDAHDIYLLATDRAPDVQMRFVPMSNAALADVLNLRAIGAAPGQGVAGFNLVFGNTGTRSAMLTDELFAIRENYSPESFLSGERNSAVGRALSPDDLTDPADPGQTAFQGALVSVGLVGTGDLDLNGPEPAYLRWGWWGGTVRYDASEALPDERLHLGSWVAGVRTDIADVLALTGTASYEGFALAHVVAETLGARAAYVEPGSFRLDYDFSARTGTATIDGILGQTVSAGVAGATALPGNHYAGTLAGGAVTGTIDGAFFRGGGDPVAATAGRFDLQGPVPGGGTATAVGIFAAGR